MAMAASATVPCTASCMSVYSGGGRGVTIANGEYGPLPDDGFPVEYVCIVVDGLERNGKGNVDDVLELICISIQQHADLADRELEVYIIFDLYIFLLPRTHPWREVISMAQ